MALHRVKMAALMVDDWLLDLMEAATHLALMTADPFSVLDPLTVEVVDYSRSAVTWTQTGRLITPTADLVFPAVPLMTTIVEVAGFNAPTNGDLVFSQPVDPFTTGAAISTVTIYMADLTVGFGTV